MKAQDILEKEFYDLKSNCKPIMIRAVNIDGLAKEAAEDIGIILSEDDDFEKNFKKNDIAICMVKFVSSKFIREAKKSFLLRIKGFS